MMPDNNHYSGAITITPPLTWSQFRDLPNSSDATLVVEESWIEESESRTVTSTASRILPPQYAWDARGLWDFIQNAVDKFPDHEFGGHIEIRWDPGYGDPCPSRYVVRDRRVEEIKARLVWPGEEPDVDALLARIEAAIDLIDGHDGIDSPFSEHWKWVELRNALLGDGGDDA